MGAEIGKLQIRVVLFLWTSLINIREVSANQGLKPCSSLLPGQYRCLEPIINNVTQQLDGCQPNNLAKTRCQVATGIKCDGLSVNDTFFKEVPCKYTNGYSFQLALVLSAVLGWVGADRFYLGYYGIGMLKLCTLGGFFLLHLLDVVLIASGILGPADGSHFVAPFYGPPYDRPLFDPNTSYVIPHNL